MHQFETGRVFLHLVEKIIRLLINHIELNYKIKRSIYLNHLHDSVGQVSIGLLTD